MDSVKKSIKSAVMQKVGNAGRRLAPSEVSRDLACSLGVPAKDVKRAMNELVFEGRLEYTFFGQSYIELPLRLIEREFYSRHLHQKTG